MIHTRTCSICEALCGIVIEHDGTKVLSIRGNPDDVLSRGHICPKAVALQDVHTDPDRLRQPVRREGERWVEISWGEALDETAARLHEVQTAHGRGSVAVYAGNPNAHNYATLLSALAFHEVLGSRSRFSATSVDQLPHMFAALHMFGHQLLFPVPDVQRTRHMIIVGANPLVSNGSIMTAPGIARDLKDIQERGGKIIVIDPRRTETAEVADEHHFVRPGTDAFLLAAMLQTLFAEGLTAGGNWRAWTRGVSNLEQFVAPFTPDAVASKVGIRADTIRVLARELTAAECGVVYSRLGACVQEFGGVAAWLTIALNLVTGNLDRVGGMMFTHPAVDLVDVAARAGQSGHFDLWRSRVSGLPEFGGELPVAALAEEMDTPGEGQIRGLITMAGNPVMSTPNGERLAKAIDGLDFYVAMDMYIGATSSRANIILPPVSPLERDHYGLALHAIAVRNATKYSERLFEPPPGARDDWQTLLELAERLNRLRGSGGKRRFGTLALRALQANGPRRALDLLLRAGPYGVLRNPFGHRLSLRLLRENSGGFDLGPLRPSFPERILTSDKMVDAAPPALMGDLPRLRAALERRPTVSKELLLIGRRSLRSNNSWLHNSARLVRGKPRCTLLMNPADAAARAVSDGDTVSVTSRVGSIDVLAELDEGMMPGVVSLPHGWGQATKGAVLAVANKAGGASVNDLTDETLVDRLTGNAALSGVPVAVGPVAAAAE